MAPVFVYSPYVIAAYILITSYLIRFFKTITLNRRAWGFCLSLGDVVYRKYVLLDKGYLGIEVFVYIIFQSGSYPVG